MRGAFARAAGRLMSAAAVVASVFVAGCADSPTEQLSRAEKLLTDLTSKGAEAYLKYELASARIKLEEARQFIRKNRFEPASQYLNSLCNTLDSCSVVFLQKRQDAGRKCEQQMSALFGSIELLRARMNGLPRLTYIDQNRYDIYTHRLRRYREEMDLLQKLFSQQDFTTALQRCLRLDFQVKQSLAGLLSVTPTPEYLPGPTNVAATISPAPPEEVRTALAASPGSSGGH